jgi:membrane fusion protein, macrolide-specific efflux system
LKSDEPVAAREGQIDMRRQTLLRRLLIAAGVVVVLAIVAFGPALLSHLTKAKVNPQLATVEPRTFNQLASATGVLQPGNLENVNFTISGQVQAVNVSIGEKVNANQLLASLNDSTQQEELSAAEFAVSAADAAILQAQATGSAAQVAQARAQLANAEVSLTTARQHEAETKLLAPETGTVLAVNGIVGDTVSAGNSGFTNPVSNGGSAIANGFIVIGNSAQFDFWAPFSQNEDVLLTSGQAAIVSVDALPGSAFPAKVASIETSATQVGGVSEYYAEIQLSTTDPRLRNGQTGSVSVTVATANSVLAVPSIALFTGPNNQTQVDVWSSGQAYATTVQIGLIGSTLTEIKSGLQVGEQVLLSPTGGTQLPAASPSPT